MLNKIKNFKEFLLSKEFSSKILIVLVVMLLMVNSISAQYEKPSEQKPEFSFENGLAFFDEDRYKPTRDDRGFPQIFPSEEWWNLKVFYFKTGNKGKELDYEIFKVAGIDTRFSDFYPREREEKIFFKKLELTPWKYNLTFHVISYFESEEPDKKLDVEFLIALIERGYAARDFAFEILDETDWQPTNEKENLWFYFSKGKYWELAKIGESAVEFLIANLKGKSDNIRADAASTLGEIGQQAVEPLIEALKDSNWKVRRQAAWALGDIKDSRVVEPLIEALKDKDKDVRENVARALGDTKDSRAVEPLIEALKDKDKDVRLHAVWALGHIKDSRAVEPLIEALKDEGIIPGYAAEALGKIKDSRAVEPLIEVLKDEFYLVREEATWALGEIKDSRAVEPLIEALKDKDNDVRENAAEALEKITKQSFGEDYETWSKWWKENKDKFIK